MLHILARNSARLNYITPACLLDSRHSYCSQGVSEIVNILTGEASASTMWDNQAWSYLHGGREEEEPPFLAQDFIHAAQPDAKIIIMLRDPVERYGRSVIQ